jgi:enamine deaminase RidA (YjgF/YER057c/UK114 family)
MHASSHRGFFYPAIKAGGLVFVSGCIPLDPGSMQIVQGGIVPQAERALANLKAVVEASGSEVSKVVKTIVSLCQAFFPRVFEMLTVSGRFPGVSQGHE